MVPEILIRIYRIFLKLYPPRFRAEFAEEMSAVNARALRQAAADGWLALARISIRELASLPGEALHQHFQGRSSRRASGENWEGPPSRAETLIAVGVFVLPVMLIGAQFFTTDLGELLLPALAVGIGLAMLAGLLRGFPRWSLPYLGLALSIASFGFVFQWAADLSWPAVQARLGPEPWGESTRLVLQALWAGLMWLSLFVLLLLVLGLLACLRRFREFLGRIYQDWTQVSYILYGGALLALVLAFEEYRYQEPYAIASSLCLAAGAMLYLHCPQRWQRGLALLSGLTLAMWTVALGKWLIVPAQDWAIWFGWHPPQSERWFEALRTMLEWGWMVVFLLAPALVRRLLAVRINSGRPT